MAIGAETVFAISKSLKELLGDQVDEVNAELVTRGGKLTFSSAALLFASAATFGWPKPHYL